MNTDKIDNNLVDEQFRNAMRKFPATVTIVTANDGTRDHGMTVTAVTSVSMDPPSMMVCLNNNTLLHEMLLKQASFAVNILSQEHVEASNAFSGKVEPELRFKKGGWVRSERGMMVLPSAHTTVFCKRMAATPFGTHTIFIGEVVEAVVADTTEALLYADAGYQKITPKT